MVISIAVLIGYNFSNIKFQVLLNMAVEEDIHGNYDKALEYYDELLLIEPAIYELHFNRGTVLAKKGDIKEADKSYKEALRIDSTDGELYYNLYLLYKSIDVKEAKMYYKLAGDYGYKE